MNHKGQTLIIFVILIPVFVLIAALVVDVGLMTYEYQKHMGIVDEGIKMYYDKGVEELDKVLELNGVEKNEYQVFIRKEEIEILLETKVNSIFGKIINIKGYEIKVNRIGKKENDKIIILKKE